MKRDIHQTWLFDHDLQEVWDCLTQPELISQWLMQNDFKPEVGHQFQFKHTPRFKMGWDGIVYGEVLEVVPLRKIVYSWKGGPKPGEISLDSVVTWELKAVHGGTQLTLSHTGFTGFMNFIASMVMEKGWKGKIRQRMEGLLNTMAHD